MIAIIACGNPTRRDDGVGSAVMQRLKAGLLGNQDAVALLDAGTDGMAVMFAARGCRSLILIDACRSGSEPGAVFEVPGETLAQDYQPSLTLHDFRWDHALAAGKQIFGPAFPNDIVVLLIEAADVDFGLSLSPAVDGVVETVARRIEALVEARLANEAQAE